MFNKSKKAFVEMQFNWIFIIIAGGVILLFFFSIVYKQKEVSDIKVTGTIKSDLRVILTGSKASTGTASLIAAPDLEISYDCQGYTIGRLSPIKPHAGFSPGLIKGYALMAWALDWNMPFRVTNFLYLTSPEIRYIIVNDATNFAEQLNETLPAKTIIQDKKRKILMNKEFVELGDLIDVEDKNNYKVRFVFFDQNPSGGLSDLDNMEDDDVTAISVYPTTGIDGYGEVEFFEKDGNNWGSAPKGTTYYVGKASLIGAVFTDDIETYDCNMKRAFKDLSIVSDVYLNRTKELVEFYRTYPDYACQAQVGRSITPLEGIKTEASSISNNFPVPVTQLSQAASELVTYNEQTQKLSCEEIY